MTDVRKCDGPDCEEFAALQKTVRMMGEMSASDFIVLESQHHEEYHFHSDKCLTNWAQENTRE